ncbi:MAG: hypothetical protein DRP26_02150 [Candidatus Zixiibacteriota bacterium]|nr:MAG: hypothetical protein DRP26_02150 [candidate division Zixibacteria bacterium]
MNPPLLGEEIACGGHILYFMIYLHYSQAEMGLNNFIIISSKLCKIVRVFRFTVIQDISDYSVDNSIDASVIDKFPEWFNPPLQFLQISLQRIIGFYTGSIRFIVLCFW